jgi:hypothetical protein
MPWKESRILDQRLQFLSSYQKEEMSVADLCRAYGISRPACVRPGCFSEELRFRAARRVP